MSALELSNQPPLITVTDHAGGAERRLTFGRAGIATATHGKRDSSYRLTRPNGNRSYPLIGKVRHGCMAHFVSPPREPPDYKRQSARWGIKGVMLACRLRKTPQWPGGRPASGRPPGGGGYATSKCVAQIHLGRPHVDVGQHLTMGSKGRSALLRASEPKGWLSELPTNSRRPKQTFGLLPI